MRRDYILLVVLVSMFGLLYGFGYRAGMYIERALSGSLPKIADSSLQTLRSTVEGYGVIHTIKGDTSLGGKAVPVFSRYPFNLKNELLIAAGDEDGIQVGDIAVVQGSILGTVEKVFKDTALVRTIFDTRFKTPVRIGGEATDALLVGGPEPKLTLIPKEAKVAESDQVYTSGEGLPYGTELGAIRNLRNSENNLFRDASLKVFYNPASLDEVVVVPKENQ